jgi:hypothetical protein
MYAVTLRCLPDKIVPGSKNQFDCFQTLITNHVSIRSCPATLRDTATERWRRHGAFSERELGGCDLCECGDKQRYLYGEQLTAA